MKRCDEIISYNTLPWQKACYQNLTDVFILDYCFRRMLVIRHVTIRRTGISRLPRGTCKGFCAGCTYQRTDAVQLCVQRKQPEHLRRQESGRVQRRQR